MSITKAGLISVVNTRLNRAYSGTDLDNIIYDSLHYLSSKGNFLKAKATRNTIVSQADYNVPTVEEEPYFETREVLELNIDDDSYNDLTYIRWKEYLKYKKVYNTDDMPSYWSQFNDFVYLLPTPNESVSLEIYFSYYHPKVMTVDGSEVNGVDNILFDDEYLTAIQEIVLWKVAENLELWDDVAVHKNEFIYSILPNLKAYDDVAIVEPDSTY